jgi:hypothetical protein
MALMFMSVSDDNFIDKTNEGSEDIVSKDNPIKTCTREEMIGFLNRVCDRNKPLFVFNSKNNISGTFGDSNTPSFSMIALIENK